MRTATAETEETKGNGRSRPQARGRRPEPRRPARPTPAPAARKTAKPAAKESKGRGGKGLPAIIRGEMIKDPTITTAGLEEVLTKKGIKYSALTVGALRSQVIAVFRDLDEAGHLKGLKL